jgi:response regulator RpfG family c-di-GMP phosphodiesterase
MTIKILLVDDDENILQAYYRNLHRHFSVEIALGGKQALLAMEHHGPFGVLVADMRMPGMSGLELLKEVKQRWPEMIRIMLTGNADQATAMDAVNHGEVFRFLTKPCDAEHLRTMIEAGLRQYQLVQAEKVLLEKTLMGSVRVLTELMSLVDPQGYERSQLVRDRAMLLGQILGCETEWVLEVACMLASIGCAVLPQDLQAKLKAGKILSPVEGAMTGRIPELGARLLENIPRLEDVTRIIRYQDKGYDGSGFPIDAVKGDEIPLGSRILKAASDFTDRVMARKDARVVIEDMKLHPAPYDPRVLEELEKRFVPFPNEQHPLVEERAMGVSELRAGMVLTRPVRSPSGDALLLPGLRLSDPALEKLNALRDMNELQEPIYVRGC